MTYHHYSACCEHDVKTYQPVGCCAYRHHDHSYRSHCNIRPQFCYTRKIRYHVNPDRRWPCHYDDDCHGYGDHGCHCEHEY